MGKLPILSGLEIIKILCKDFGFREVHRKGSHIILAKNTSFGKVACTVPKYPEIDPGLLSSILRQAKIERDEFLRHI